MNQKKHIILMFQYAMSASVKHLLMVSRLFLLWGLWISTHSVASAQIEAPKSDSLFFDLNGNELANPGDSIRYILVIKNNNSSKATNIIVPNGTDVNTNLDLSSIKTSPLAIDDGPYLCTGNMGLAVPSSSGVLGNDFDDDIGALTLLGVGMNSSTAQGGNITLAADGSFTYNAPPGFEGSDSVMYVIQDGTPAPNCPIVNSGWIRFTISDMIWFIDENVSGGSNNGTLNEPFETLAAFEAINGNAGTENPGNGDHIFLHSSTTVYTGGITLEPDQKLMGQGMNSTVAVVTGITLPPHSLPFPSVSLANPVITESGGFAISLANSNEIRGLDIGSSGSASPSGGLGGNNVGALKILEDVSIFVSSSGPAVDIDGGGSIDVMLSQIATTNSSSEGIDLNNISGGTFSISGSTDVVNSTSTAIDLTASAIDLQFNSVTIDNSTSNAAGINASGGGSLGVTSGTLTIEQNKAVSIDGTAIRVTGVTFNSIDCDGMSTTNTAIALKNSGAGPFTSNGGTIENINDIDAITLNNTEGLVTLNNMTIEDIDAANDASAPLGTRSGVDAIHGENVKAGLSMSGSTIRRVSDNAINGALFSDGVSATLWTGLLLNGCTIKNSNRFHVANKGDDSSEGLIRIMGISGIVAITSSMIELGARGLDFSTPASAGTLDMTVTSCNFTNIIKEFDCNAPTINVGGRGISVGAKGDHNVVVRIGHATNAALKNTFTNNATASVVVFSEENGSGTHTGNTQVLIANNDFIITDHLTGLNCLDGNFLFNFPQGGVSLNPAGSGTYEAIVDNNLFDQVMHAAGGLGQLTLGINTGPKASEFIVRNNEFKLPWDAAVQIRAEGNGSSAVLFENNTYTDGMVGGPNDDLDMMYPSPFQGVLVNVRKGSGSSGGSLDLTMKNETFPVHDNTNSPTAETITVEVQADGMDNELNLFLENTKAPWGLNFMQNNGTFDLFKNGSASATVPLVLQDNGNTGGGGVDGTTPPAVMTTGTITLSNTAPTLPNIVIN